MLESFDRCYRAVGSRDARFDGWFFTAVTSTGIYCRPSCPARTPKPANVRFYATAAAAQQAGFRACLRCRPDAAPGSPEWLGRADVAARAVRLILDGAVDRDGVAGLARPPRLLRAPAPPRADGRGRHRRAVARPRPAGPDGPPAAPDDRPADHPGRAQRRLREPAPVQRDRPRDLRPDADRAPPPRTSRPRGPERRAPRAPRRSPCACRSAGRSPPPSCSLPRLARGRRHRGI